MSTGIKSNKGFIALPFYLIVCTILVFSLTNCLRTGSDDKFHGTSLLQELSSSHTGIQFINQLHESDTNNPLFYEYYYNGAGMAVGDINNDGLSDIFFGANMERSCLYLNKGGLKFEDITEISGINTEGSWITGVNLVDINQDGWPDIYLSVGGNIDDDYRNKLYISNGEKDHLFFTEQAEVVGLQDDGYSTQAAFFDYDRDGDMDMYLVTSAMNIPNKNAVRRPVGDGTHITTDRLYRNEGTDPVSQLPKFLNVSREAGINWDGFGLGISISDINRDGWPDIYVSNDYISNDLLYINQGDGTFKNDIRNYFKHVSYSTMGMDIADFNNDGLVDVFTLDMLPEDYFRKRIMAGNMRSYERYSAELKADYLEQYIRNMLQLNNGALNGEYSFSEIGQLAGVFETDWSWAPLFADLDNDTYKDLFVSNGIPHDLTNMDYSAIWMTTMKKNPSIEFEVLRAILMKDLNKRENVKKPNVIYRNSGGYIFDDVSKEWGMDKPLYSTSAVFSDLDNDGDLDLVLNNINDPASVYENNLIDRTGPESSTHYLVIHLSGSEFNRNGIGSSITLYHNNQMQFSEHFPVRGFQSTVDRKIHFGLGGNLVIDSLFIQWPDGKIQYLYDVPANQALVLNHRDASEQEYQHFSEGSGDLIFKEVSDDININFEHRERDFVDFDIQPLIPHMYSREGPGITAGDVNADGLDDFFIGGSTGFAGEVFIQDESGEFSSHTLPGNKNFEDMGALFFDADADGDDDLYVVSGGTGLPPGNPFYADRLFLNRDRGEFELIDDALPSDGVCGSQVTASDFDKDGDLDLFVCGRVDLENYPLPPRSYLLRNDSDGSIVRFTDVTSSIGMGLENAGLISAALWSDFNKDGWTDLILAGEWIPIKFYQNVKGVFQDVTRNTGLENYPGWWNSLVAADFDGDGDMDYVAGNLGLNTRYKVSQDQPMRIVAKDFDMNGILDPVVSYYVQGESYPIYHRNLMLSQLPYLRNKFELYEDFARATMSDLFTEDEISDAYIAECRFLESAYIENSGDGSFHIRPLPIEAQFAPVFGMLANDYNSDGNFDLLLVGNFHSSNVEDGQHDAFKGLFLEGDGSGKFSPVLMSESGFFVDGDAKGMAEITSSDGNSLILVAQNAGDMKVYKTGKPDKHTLRLKRDDVRAEIIYGTGETGYREFYYGSGYLSHSSRVCHLPENVVAVRIISYTGEIREVTGPPARISVSTLNKP
jgi:hypothetical protein